MSVEAVSFSRITCDGCGSAHPGIERGATSARIAASRDGWKFAEFPDKDRSKKGPRMWDACTDCDLPATAEDAMRALQDQGRVTR